jgi:hypothetical protein
VRVRVPLAAATVCVMTLAACGEQAPAPTAAVTPVVVSASAPVETPRPTPSPPPGGSLASYPPSPGGGDVVADESLLDILPPALDGLPVTAEDQAFADAANDPAFRRNVARAVFPIVVSDEDLASGVVAQLIPDRYTDEFFRDWRDSYDEGACGQAGGVAGNAETDLGGRTVYIGTCAGGLRTYHAWLEERNVIVSLFAIGEGRFGERLMSDLRP